MANNMFSLVCTCESVDKNDKSGVILGDGYHIILLDDIGLVIVGGWTTNELETIKVQKGDDYRHWVSEDYEGTMFTTNLF